MIKVPVSSAVLVFLIVTVAFILVMWLLGERRSPEGNQAGRKTEEHIWKCPICTHVYLETDPAKMSTCPVCGSINTSKESEKIDLKNDEV